MAQSPKQRRPLSFLPAWMELWGISRRGAPVSPSLGPGDCCPPASAAARPVIGSWGGFETISGKMAGLTFAANGRC